MSCEFKNIKGVLHLKKVKKCQNSFVDNNRLTKKRKKN